MGDVLCDIGKYMLTVIPFTYVMADRPSIPYVIATTAFFGLLFIIFGLYFVKVSETNAFGQKAKKKKYRLLKNAVFTVEEDS